MELDQVQEAVKAHFESFLTTWLPTGPGPVQAASGADLGTLGVSGEVGVAWMLNCGLGDDSLPAKDADNLLVWWRSLGLGRDGQPPAKSDTTNKVEVHLFGYKHQHQSSGALVKYKFNYHVPISGQVGVQLKGYQQQEIRRGKRSVQSMGLQYKAKNT